jgi:hypothetical protein
MRRVFTVSDDRAFLWIVAAVAAALLALWASAAPAFAQDNMSIGDDVEYNGVCQNIIGAIGDITQTQTGNATAIDRDRRDAADVDAASTVEASAADSTADASAEATVAEATVAEATVADPTAGAVAQVAQEQGVSIAQVNECLNAADNVKPPDNGTTDDGTTGDDDGDVGALTKTPHGVVLTVSIPEQKVLADTGGMPLSGLALIGLGLMAAGVSLLRFGGWR